MTSTSPQIRAADHLIDQLTAQGIDQVFGVPGESYLPVLDALHGKEDKIRFVTFRQEGGAAMAYLLPATINLAIPIKDIGWKAQTRLCKRYRDLSRTGKPQPRVLAAIARAGWLHLGHCKENASFGLNGRANLPVQYAGDGGH